MAFMGTQAREIVSVGPFLEAFLGLIVVPLVLALLTQWWARKQQTGERFLDATAWLPVPFMALTLLLLLHRKSVNYTLHLNLLAK